jgi:hypothetical protein
MHGAGAKLAAASRRRLIKPVDAVRQALEIGDLTLAAGPQLLHPDLRFALLAHRLGYPLALRLCISAQ